MSPHTREVITMGRKDKHRRVTKYICGNCKRPVDMNKQHDCDIDAETSTALTKYRRQEDTIVVWFTRRGQELLRLEDNGDIYYRGVKIDNDQMIVDGLRDFLIDQGYL